VYLHHGGELAFKAKLPKRWPAERTVDAILEMFVEHHNSKQPGSTLDKAKCVLQDKGGALVELSALIQEVLQDYQDLYVVVKEEQEPAEASHAEWQPVAAERPQHWDSNPESITVEWAAVPAASWYQVDWRAVCPPGEEPCEWSTASATLKGNVVRKKKLSAKTLYEFRVRAAGSPNCWGDFSDPSDPISTARSPKISPPQLVACDHETITVNWAAFDVASAYWLQVRPETWGARWQDVAVKLPGSVRAFRVKNLTPGIRYVLRVRPFLGGEWEAWSTPSAPFIVGLSRRLLEILGESLLDSRGYAVPSHTLHGKLVLLFFGKREHMQSTLFFKQLVQWYKEEGVSDKRDAAMPLEVVYVSRDNDNASFLEYLRIMPWLALPFNSPQRLQAALDFQRNPAPGRPGPCRPDDSQSIREQTTCRDCPGLVDSSRVGF